MRYNFIKKHFYVERMEKNMETIKFRIIKENCDMCRIETSDCRTVYRNIADGACICSLDVMLSEIERISNKVEKLGNKAVLVLD